LELTSLALSWSGILKMCVVEKYRGVVILAGVEMRVVNWVLGRTILAERTSSREAEDIFSITCSCMYVDVTVRSEGQVTADNLRRREHMWLVERRPISNMTS
jgi:hypothetical protein